MTGYAMTARELTSAEMTRVNGGTFTPNTYHENTYHTFGISTRYHFFDADEFMFMGRRITCEQADAIVELGRLVGDALNQGSSGKDVIGYGEKAFIRAFNSQLQLKFGFMWDGVPGSSY